MGMLVEGLNQVRDYWNTLHDTAELGTGTTQETGDDTDLQTPIAGSETSVITNTTEDQYLVKEATFYGVNGSGESVTEIAWKTSSPELAGSRITFTAQTWTEDAADIIIETRWSFLGRKG